MTYAHTTHFSDCGCFADKLQKQIDALKAERDLLAILVRDAEIIFCGMFRIENEEQAPAMNAWIKRVQAITNRESGK